MLKVNLWVWGSCKERSSFSFHLSWSLEEVSAQVQVQGAPTLWLHFFSSKGQVPCTPTHSPLADPTAVDKAPCTLLKDRPPSEVEEPIWSFGAWQLLQLVIFCPFISNTAAFGYCSMRKNCPNIFLDLIQRFPHSAQYRKKKSPTHVIWMALYQKRWGKCQLYLFSLLYQTFLFPQWMCRLQPLSWHILSSRLY